MEEAVFTCDPPPEGKAEGAATWTIWEVVSTVCGFQLKSWIQQHLDHAKRNNNILALQRSAQAARTESERTKLEAGGGGT